MRICEYNGRVIEMQSHATAGTLLANAAAAGIVGATEREVTQQEYNALMLSQRNPNDAIDVQIRALEGTTERGIREAMLYTLVALAATQGVTEPQLYASNFGYRKAKDLDDAIAALRAQRV